MLVAHNVLLLPYLLNSWFVLYVNDKSTLTRLSTYTPAFILLGVRDHLAHALVGAFGGHVLQLARALEDLALYRESYVVSYSLISCVEEQISRYMAVIYYTLYILYG